MRATHSQQLERWLGAEQVEDLSRQMRGWYGPPILLAGVPGPVLACGDGDFCGRIRGGRFASAIDHARDFGARRLRSFHRNVQRSRTRLNAGFAGLADLISEANHGKRQTFMFSKNLNTGGVGIVSSPWGFADFPVAGGAASAAPGGRAPDNTTTGAFPFVNPPSGDTTHIVSSSLSHDASTQVRNYLIYDRIFDVAKTMSSTGTEAVTGVPTRYQSTTGGADNSAEGNFLFIEVQTGLSATAHNWTVCQYTNQAGTTGQTLPSVTGTSGATAGRIDHPIHQWFAILANGDTGVKALTQMQCSASVTGAVNFVIGHPIAWISSVNGALMCNHDYVLGSFNLARIFDSACLAILATSNTGAATQYGNFQTVSG